MNIANEKLDKIKSIMTVDMNYFSTTEQAVVRNEYITKVLLDVDIDDQERELLNKNANKNERKLLTPVQELVRQYEMLPCTYQNNQLLRTFLALMVNNRHVDIEDAFKSAFPEYH